MIATHRQMPSISYPISNDQPHPPRGRSPASPPRTPPHRHRPSLSNPMTWLGRSSASGSNNSVHPVVSKPIQISEPKFVSSTEILTPPRWGSLGTGATIVRTPQDALCGSGVQMTPDGEGVKDGGQQFESPVEEIEEEKQYSDGELYEDRVHDLPSPPHSPSPSTAPLSKSSPAVLTRKESPLSEPSRITHAPPSPASSTSTFNSRPSLNSRSPPSSEYAPPSTTVPTSITSSPPLENLLLPSIKSRSPPCSEYSSPATALPAHITLCPVQPPFDAILISSMPASNIDTSKIIITLETSTATFRTTFTTLTSRPSYLSKFVTSLLPDPPTPTEDDLDNMSEHSSQISNAFHSIFHNHLAAAGILAPTSAHIHIFLDRPSASYPHILSYLRSLPAPMDSPPALPRAVHLLLPNSRLETLLELRDEARYLGLQELYKICVDEILLQTPPTSGQLTITSEGSTHPGAVTGVGIGAMEPVREVPEDDLGSSLFENRDPPVITRSDEGHIRSPSAPNLGHTRTGNLSQRGEQCSVSVRARTPHARWI